MKRPQAFHFQPAPPPIGFRVMRADRPDTTGTVADVHDKESWYVYWDDAGVPCLEPRQYLVLTGGACAYPAFILHAFKRLGIHAPKYPEDA